MNERGKKDLARGKKRGQRGKNVTGIGSNVECIKQLEEGLDWLASHSNVMTEMLKSIREFSELVLDQATIIRLLQEQVRELELGHGVLWARVIHIEVGG